MKHRIFGHLILWLLAGAALAGAGCSGSGSSSAISRAAASPSPNRPQGLPPSTLTAGYIRSLPSVTLPGIPGAVRISAPALRVATAASQAASRAVLSNAGPGDAEVVGTVMFGGGKYTGVYAQHSAYSATAFPLNYPAGASGSQELFAPLTLPTNGGCLSSGTVALNIGGGNNYTFFVVFDYCGAGAPKLVAGAQIDDPRDTTHFFKNNYVFTNAHGLPVYATLNFTPDAVPTAQSTWYVLLYNTKTSTYNVVYQDTGTSGTTYGYSVYESLYQPGPCPSALPPVGVDYLMLYSASTGAFEPVAPTMTGTTSVAVTPSKATACFTAGSGGPASQLFAMTTPNSAWTVTSGSGSATTVTEHALAQEGLAIALASTVLQSQLIVLEGALGGSTNAACTALPDAGSSNVISTKTTAPVTTAVVGIYYDAKCTQPFINETATVTQAATAYNAVGTATYTGLTGANLGALTVNETAYFDASGAPTGVSGIGTFTPTNGTPPVKLGLTCTFPDVTATPVPAIPCAGGVAQDFPALGLALGSVTPLMLNAPDPAQPVTFSGTNSTIVSGAIGALSVTAPTTSTLAIAGTSSPYSASSTNGSAAKFSLFPPTPTSWKIVDSQHDAQFAISVANNTVRNSTGSVTQISTGKTLATLSADQSGTGTVTYSDGTQAPITSWLLGG